MSDENKDAELQTWIDPELEARVVAWALGEASEFEAAELARIVAEKPELAVFKRRIEAVHGLVAAASKMELEPMRMSEDRRRKLIETLGSKEAGAAAAVVAMPGKQGSEARRSRWRWVVEVAAVLIILAVLASISVPRFAGVQTRALTGNLMPDVVTGLEKTQETAQTAPIIERAEAVAAPVDTERLAALDALKKLANQPRVEDEKETVEAAAGGVASVTRSLRGNAGEVNGRHDQYANQTYEETRAQLLWELDNGWKMPVHKFGVKGAENSNPATSDVQQEMRARGAMDDSDGADAPEAGGAAAAAGAAASDGEAANVAAGKPATDFALEDEAAAPSGPPPAAAPAAPMPAAASMPGGAAESEREQLMDQVEKLQANAKAGIAGSRVAFKDAGVAQTGQLAFNGPSQPSVPITVNEGLTIVHQSPSPEDELAAADQPYSTFSLHVSDVSFLLASAELANGQMPDPDSIRPEEFYNAFDYGDPAPANGEKIACHIEQAAHPILQQRNLVRIAMKVAATGRGDGQPLRLTVLLDTSGSMEREDRAASVQRAMEVLTSLLGPNDAVTLIGFARQPRLLAEEARGDQAAKLLDIVKHTPPEGGTNMEEAIKTASELALRHFEKGGQNRVVMLTDGAANLGDADPAQLSKLVDALRQQGVSFDACGVGADGLNDDILEALTRKGGGRYYFLNRPSDADEGFARQLAGAFRPAAENVKMQVRFNPDRVGKYKLIGFEKNRLNQEDFRNDKVTAAQLAAEEAAVALYQVQVLPEGEGEIGEVFVRFRDPADGRMVEQSWTIPYDPQAPALDKASPSMKLATTAALVAEKLRGGPGADAIDMDALEPVVTSLRGYYAQQGRVREFATMFEQVRRMTARK